MKKTRTATLLLTSSILLTSCWFKSNKIEEVKKEKIDITAFEENDKKRNEHESFIVEEAFINGKKVKIDVQNHGDHYHIIYNGKKYSLTKNEYKSLFHKNNKIVLDNFEEKKLSDLDKNEIISYEKHGDHWHVKTKNGEFITYEDPLNLKTVKDVQKNSVTTVSKKDIKSLSIKSYRKHGDHWHITTTDGREYISYENPEGKNIENIVKNIENNENDKIVEVVTDVPQIDVFDKVVDHGDHVHVWVNGKEYVISKDEYEKSKKDNEFDEKDKKEIVSEVIATENIGNSLFEKVVDHGDHVHVWVNGIEYSINRELYEEFLRENKFDEKKARGEVGDTISEETDEELKKQLEYISKVYGVPIEAIKYSEEFFSFNDPRHEYDPTHIHPYFIARSKFRIPEVTGIPEIDFENELLALSERTGIAPNKIEVSNGKFVLSHGDHNHYLNILTTGYDDYMKNRLPDIEGKKIEGEFNREVVEKRINELLEQNDKIYKDLVLNRRRKRALLEFKDRINENANSTKGYLAMLDEFDKLYINVVEGAEKTELDERTVAFNNLLKRIDSKNEKFFSSFGITKEDLIGLISDSVDSEEKLYKAEFFFSELERFSGKFTMIGMGYVEYFVNNLDSNFISPKLKEDISTVLLEMNDNGQRGFFRPQFWALRLINLNIRLTKELSLGKTYEYDDSLVKYKELNTPEKIGKIKKFLEDIKGMSTPIVKPDTSKYGN